MSIITAANTGSWSAGATWTGGVKPGVGDTARANGKTITIDENVTCAQLDTLTNGGAFNCSDAVTRTITANILAGTTNCLNVTAGNVTVNGTCTGGSAANAFGAQTSGSTACTLTITGTVTGGSNSSAYGASLSNSNASLTTGACVGATALGIYNNSLGSVTINGTVTVTGTSTGAHNASGGSITVVGNVTASGASAIVNSNTGPVTVTGSVLGGAINPSLGIDNAGGGAVVVNGNVTGGTSTGSAAGSASGVKNGSSGTVTINGSVTGGSAGNSNAVCGVYQAGSGTVTITGNATGGTLAAAVGAVNAHASGELIVQGLAIGSSTVDAAGVQNISTGLTRIGGAKWGLAASPTIGKIRVTDGTSNTAVFLRHTDASEKTLVDSAATVTYPSAANLRYGTTANSGNIVGTLRVPAANKVAVGEPVDNTVGTAVLTEATVQASLTAQGYTTARAAYLDTLAEPAGLTPDQSATLAAIAATVAANLDAAISSRLAAADYSAPPPAGLTDEQDSTLSGLVDALAALAAAVAAIKVPQSTELRVQETTILSAPDRPASGDAGPNIDIIVTESQA